MNRKITFIKDGQEVALNHNFVISSTFAFFSLGLAILGEAYWQDRFSILQCGAVGCFIASTLISLTVGVYLFLLESREIKYAPYSHWLNHSGGLSFGLTWLGLVLFVSHINSIAGVLFAIISIVLIGFLFSTAGKATKFNREELIRRNELQ
jgi:hypothetical protein